MPKQYFPGHLLVANPNNPIDDLYKSVILLVSHTADIAIGVQINSIVDNLDLQAVAESMDLWFIGDDPLWFGGPENNNKIHVIHSTDWRSMSTVQITDEIAVTNDISILAAISQGEGPEYYRACAGYWVWKKGKLDAELTTSNQQVHKWEVIPADSELVFDADGSDQWRWALEESARYQVSNWL